MPRKTGVIPTIPPGLYPANELAALRELQLEACRNPRGTERAEKLTRLLRTRDDAIRAVRGSHTDTFASGDQAAHVLRAIDAAFARLKPSVLDAIERAASGSGPDAAEPSLRAFALGVLLRGLAGDLLPQLREHPQADAAILLRVSNAPRDGAYMWSALVVLADIGYARRVRDAIDASDFRARLAKAKGSLVGLAIKLLVAAKPAPTYGLSARTLRRAASAAGLTDPERVERARRARASRAKRAAG